MNDEQQRIAIAKSCGWHRIGKDGFPSRWHGFPPSGEANPYPLPDYLNDLNAMHEAEKVLFSHISGGLTTSVLEDYETNLCRVIVSIVEAECIHATAAQRAEAFLKTIGKWEDDK